MNFQVKYPQKSLMSIKIHCQVIVIKIGRDVDYNMDSQIHASLAMQYLIKVAFQNSKEEVGYGLIL